MWLFTDAILAGRPIRLFNAGQMKRDFTYIDDIVESVVRLIEHVPTGDPHWSGDDPAPPSSRARWRLYNIGNNQPVDLLDVVALLEAELGRKAERELLPMQPGDVPATYADVADLEAAVGFKPKTSIEEGIRRFVAWYRDYKGHPNV
jgi:UDP-glucuronate 4-epimerase